MPLRHGALVIRGVQMESEIKVGQRFKFNSLSDNGAPERLAVVTRVLSDREKDLGRKWNSILHSG